MKIKDIGNVVTGKTPQTAHAEFYGGDYMFITPTELHGGYKISSSEKTLTEAGLESIKTNSIDGISVLVGCIGWDMGNVAMCFEKCATNQQINSITQISEDYSPYFLYYWLSTKKEYLFSISSVTRTPILSKGVFEEIEIPSISRSEQDKIAKVLLVLDKKIKLNSEVNDNLAQQLRLLYDYWFTQFDFPDESGNPYRSSGGQMVWNSGLKRKIPESWCVVPLGEVSSFRNGINYDKNTTGDTTYHIVNVRNISSSSILLDERELDEICLPCTQAEKYLVSNESILIARSGIPGAPRILYNPSEDIIFCGFIICATPIDSILQHYLMLFLKQLEGSTATQTGGSILKNVSQDTLRDLLVPIPSKDILTQFNQRVALIYEFMHNNLEETSKLQNLRDWLLPMLMNGQATISD